MKATYKAQIGGSVENGFYASVVRTYTDGAIEVDFGFKPRHFATRKAAEKATNAYLQKRA